MPLVFHKASSSDRVTAVTSDIQSVTQGSIRDMVRDAVRSGLDAGLVADFLAGIDWSAFDAVDGKVRSMLGSLEAWSTEYSEGNLTVGLYVERLLSLLPSKERSKPSSGGKVAGPADLSGTNG